MCSKLVPQQPPTIDAPAAIHFGTSLAICSGVTGCTIFSLTNWAKPASGFMNWDFPFQFAMKHPDLHCFVTNNIPMVPCCQSRLRGPAIASSTSEPYTAAPGILVHQRWQSSPSRKRSYYPHLSHLAACISSAALSRVIGLTWLSAPEWQQIGL